jgi:hypothetical protein
MMAHMKTRRFVSAGLALWAGACALQLGYAQTKSSTPPALPAATVPFFGCASDGQAGLLKAPSGKSRVVAIPAVAAKRLAYYKAEYSEGVLAPRGWHCFSTYGSNGASLFVSPDPIDSKTVLLSENWKGFAGPAVQLSVSIGGTSGRFDVAKVVARVFPAYKAFAQKVIAEEIEPASDFPFGPYPADNLTYRGQNVVEFETPANSEGLGTNSRLLKNASPIDGVAIIAGEDTDLIQLFARVANIDQDLVPYMIRQVESEVAPSTAPSGTAQ